MWNSDCNNSSLATSNSQTFWDIETKGGVNENEYREESEIDAKFKTNTNQLDNNESLLN